jgi:hypothetical protein
MHGDEPSAEVHAAAKGVASSGRCSAAVDASRANEDNGDEPAVKY